jgi:hypothetical protein
MFGGQQAPRDDFASGKGSPADIGHQLTDLSRRDARTVGLDERCVAKATSDVVGGRATSIFVFRLNQTESRRFSLCCPMTLNDHDAQRASGRSGLQATN